jgi:1,4-dihydroxy-2-naphthoate octaprenyltransferase
MSKSAPAGWRVWIEATRPKTLPAAVAPVLVASALAFRDAGFSLGAAMVCLAFALLIQVGTNYANDYFDFVKGADSADRVGPRRAVAAGLIAPATMKRAMLLVFAVAFGTGLLLLNFGGWPLLVIGVLSIFCGVIYTGGPYPLAYHGWGDVFVFVFFGLVAVTATYFVQIGHVSFEAWALGAGIGGLATNILVVNNYRDIETDRRAGKKTLVVRWGRGFAQAQFVAAHFLLLIVLVTLSERGYLSPFATLGLLLFTGLVGGRQTFQLRNAKTAPELILLLGSTGKHVAMVAVAVSLGLVVSPH